MHWQGHPMRRGAVYGLAAAALFGASAPFAKLFLNQASPLVLAGLLYSGAGLGLSVARPFTGRLRPAVEAPIRRGDIPLLVGLIALGGIAGPVLMLVGLTRELRAGDTFDLTLLYERGHEETVQVVVMPEN